ncbi:MAG: hypothetical protein E6Q62_05430 [Nitrosomonas sp.]|nr:MAG: hypothetical protein E6Q62_05430 [Nitrosomonas sp.]
MKVMQVLIVIVFLFLFHGSVYGTAIVFTGFQCLNAINPQDTSVSNTPIQSRFEVVEDVGEGMFRLNLTGGIPRIVNNNQNICIDNVTALGYSGIAEVDGLPAPLQSIDATAYFSGKDLVIVINSLFTDLSARRDSFASFFSTSNIFAITNTLFFEFNSLTFSFRLNKLIHNRGYTQTTSGSTNFIPFLETVLPSFNDIPRDKPRILTPISSIDYVLE